MSWQERAACRNTDPEIFFPLRAKYGTDPEAQPALAFCDVCPVARLCLEYALDHHERDGIWGGATEYERRQIMRRRRAGLDS